MGLYGVILFSQNKLGFYIHPRFFEESLLASIVAIIVGAFSIFIFFKEVNKKELIPKELVSQRTVLMLITILLSFIFNSLFLILSILILVSPNTLLNKLLKTDIFGNSLLVLMVGIGLLIPPQTLSSITASQRSIDLNAINLTQTTISAVQNFNKSTSNFSLGDWIAMQGFNPDPLFYENKEVKVSGFIYKPDSINMPENFALVARFIVTCCAVDARPVGLKFDKSNFQDFKEDQWVEVTGTFAVTENNELYIKPKEIKLIEIPSNPYIF